MDKSFIPLYLGQPEYHHYHTFAIFISPLKFVPYFFTIGNHGPFSFWTFYLYFTTIAKWIFLYHHVGHIHYDVVLTFLCQKIKSINKAMHYANITHPIIIYNISTNTQWFQIEKVSFDAILSILSNKSVALMWFSYLKKLQANTTVAQTCHQGFPRIYMIYL